MSTKSHKDVPTASSWFPVGNASSRVEELCANLQGGTFNRLVALMELHAEVAERRLNVKRLKGTLAVLQALETVVKAELQIRQRRRRRRRR